MKNVWLLPRYVEIMHDLEHLTMSLNNISYLELSLANSPIMIPRPWCLSHGTLFPPSVHRLQTVFLGLEGKLLGYLLIFTTSARAGTHVKQGGQCFLTRGLGEPGLSTGCGSSMLQERHVSLPYSTAWPFPKGCV